jgi:hypothetical protein
MENASFAMPLRDRNGSIRAMTYIDEADRATVEAYKWHLSHWGYACCSRPDMRLHRFIMQAAAGLVVDHINGNKLDNRRCNLRLASNTDNVRNQKLHKNNKTGYKGVSLDKRTGLYVAGIMVNRRNYCLGSFADPKTAHEAYLEAAKAHFGEFANPG